jgi:hypothetical protein
MPHGRPREVVKCTLTKSVINIYPFVGLPLAQLESEMSSTSE